MESEKALMINACCSCRYFEEMKNHKTERERHWCTFGPDRVIPMSRIDVTAEFPEWCPLPDWNRMRIIK